MWNLEDLKEFETVRRWCGNLRASTARTHMDAFKLFMGWLAENGGQFSGMNPDQLVAYQQQAKNYEILDVVQGWVKEYQHLRHNTVTRYYAVVRSFFKHNRASLPEDVYRPRASKPPVDGDLRFDELKRLILASNPMYRAIWCCMYCGLMGAGEIIRWSNTGYKELMRQIKADKPIIEVTQSGRKKYLNVMPFYNLIGGDARRMLVHYVTNVRRPGPGPIFINKHGGPLKHQAMYVYYTNKLVQLGIIERPEDATPQTRYGKNPHEIRDLARTRWKRSQADVDLAEFMLGHMNALDPNKYEKIYKDREYSKREYMKALPWMNILSEDPEKISIYEHEQYMDRITQLEKEIEAMRPAQEHMEDLMILLRNPETAKILEETARKLSDNT